MVLRNDYALLTKFKQEQHFKNFCSEVVIFHPLKNNNTKKVDRSILSKAKGNVLWFRNYKRSFCTSIIPQYQIKQKHFLETYCSHVVSSIIQYGGIETFCPL